MSIAAFTKILIFASIKVLVKRIPWKQSIEAIGSVSTTEVQEFLFQASVC